MAVEADVSGFHAELSQEDCTKLPHPRCFVAIRMPTGKLRRSAASHRPGVDFVKAS